MSERGTADLLNINQMALNRMKTSGLPKNLKAFTSNSLNVKTTNIIVEINNVCHEKRVSVYNTFVVMELIKVYVLALAHRKLQKNQLHIGERCVIIQNSLVRTALDAAIKEACGITPQIQETAQKNYTALDLIKE